MSKVVLSIPKLGVTNKGWEDNKEIYIMSFVGDLRPVDAPRVTEAISAYNETLPNVVPSVAEEALMKFVLLAVSNVFQRVRADQPVSLSGSGVLLYPALDPNGMLASHFVVLEDDHGRRHLGKLLENLFANDDIMSLVAKLQRNVTQPLVGTLFNALASNLPAILEKNKDDFLFSHSHSGFPWDNYGCRPGETTSEFELGNDRAFCTLRVAVIGAG
ncbi:MAG: hypothetical protein MI919_16845 [Holophagales bacterium]|nr:hypothetical protein [Holophagales bacterium]